MTSGKTISPAPVFALFFLSGISGLMYETVWLRMLSRVLGNTVYATSVVIAAFMAGLALGSYLLGVRAERIKNILGLYALLETGVGAAALMLLPVFSACAPLYRQVYALVSAQRLYLCLFQGGLIFLILLIPTCFMGGTLPLLSAYLKRCHPSFAGRLGVLYGLNTLGAFIGVIGSGFFCIGSAGERETVALGAAINLAVALLAYRRARQSAALLQVPPKRFPGTAPAPAPLRAVAGPRRGAVAAAYALSGFISIAYEIVWSRIFQIQAGTSIYAFCLMLAWYLAGIASGSLWAGTYMRAIRDPLKFFGFTQLGVALYGMLGMYLFPLFSPAAVTGILNLGNVLVMPFIIVFPLTFMLGALFPVVARLYMADGADAGRGVGVLYAVNTLGCICGSFVCGFLLIGLLGTRGTMVFLSGLTAFGMKGRPLSRQLWITGVGMTKLCTQTKIMARLPRLLNSPPRSILVICCGMGTTLRSAWTYPDLRCDTVELVPETFDCFRYFHADAEAVFADPRVRRFADDGRNFLMMREERYDVITIDPPPPVWSAGTVNLYTREFFTLCKDRLQPGGRLCVWIPPMELSEALMIIKTLHTVFPNTWVWRGPFNPDGVFLTGFKGSARPDVSRFFAPPENTAIIADLNEWDALFPTLDTLLRLLVLTPEQLALLDKNVPVITDNNPYTEFPLWRSISSPLYRVLFTAQRLAAVRNAAAGAAAPAGGHPE